MKPEFNAMLAQRIAQASIPVTECGCWIWCMHIDEIGYGTLRVNGKMAKAHRASWVAHRGAIPPQTKVLHRCDVRCCVNPDHLFLGSQADNVRDMVTKGRQHKFHGERNPNAKLTAADVAAIRLATGSHSQVARRFGVGKSIIGYIRSRHNWRVV